MREDYDAIVVGAGPSGSTAATLLAQAGWRVAVVEKARNAVRTGKSPYDLMFLDTQWTIEFYEGGYLAPLKEIDASFDLDPVRDMALPAGNAINDLLQSMASGGSELRIPPACLLDMQGEPLEYGEGVSLSVRFPVLARNANPLRHMQGGYLMATLDNPLVPFSYLIAPPSVASARCTVARMA